MADSQEAPYQPAMRQQIQLFTSADGQAQLQVALEHDTLWLSQAQMGELFDTTPENVLMHLKNIFNDGELAELATTKDFLVVRQEGARHGASRHQALQPGCHHLELQRDAVVAKKATTAGDGKTTKSSTSISTP